jgi:methyl-accepting chemotaxis protein
MGLFDLNRAKLNTDIDELARFLDRFAQDDVSGAIHCDSPCMSRLTRSVRGLQDRLVHKQSDTTALGKAVAAMRRSHEDGEIDAQIELGALAEPYRSVAADINALVKSHIDVNMKVVDTVARYADGDFSVTMDNVSGKKTKISAAMDRAKATFESVVAQAAASEKFVAALAEMTKQHELGWIDESIPVDEFSAGYRRAAELVNALVKSHIDVKMKVVAVVTKYAQGDFSVSMDRLPGAKAKITEAIDRVRDALPKPDEIAEMKRTRAALEIVNANVMIADANNVICYMNRSVNKMMRDAERDLQKDLPNFRSDRLISAKIDQFHKNPSYQTHMLAELKGTHVADIIVGGRSMRLLANPLLDETGQRIGAVVEWNDRTAEVAIEQETTAVVDSAGRGDFTQRLSLQGREGFFKQLAENINRLVDNSDVALNDVVRVLGALAKNDLTETIESDYDGTFGRLKDDSNATVASLTNTVIEIKAAADNVSTSAREISAGNSDLSKRTEVQASSLEETAAAMEELTATVRQNSENARQANELAIGASGIAVKGGEVVGEVVETMAAINASAKKIVDIISVIDGIAFQTNILALNAAVEAARAGEQGRGFAVVAGEVRTLAQRSAAAAKEIKSLIGDSVEKTTTGRELVDQAGATMAEIVASVKRVTDIMGLIATASQEQGNGIEQVNASITQMDKVTQQNAALVEEVAASAMALEERARSLVDMVGVFTIADDHAPMAHGPKSHRPKPAHPASAKLPAVARSVARSGASAARDEDWNSV